MAQKRERSSAELSLRSRRGNGETLRWGEDKRRRGVALYSPPSCRKMQSGVEPPHSIPSATSCPVASSRGDLLQEVAFAVGADEVDDGDEFALFEGAQGAETAAEFERVENAFAEEPAKKLFGGAFLFLCIAIVTTGDEVAIGIVAEAELRDDVVQGPDFAVRLAQTIEAFAAFAVMDRAAEDLETEEVGFFDVDGLTSGAGHASGRFFRCLNRGNFRRKIDADDVLGLATAGNQLDDAMRDEAAECVACAGFGDTQMVGHPGERELEFVFAFEMTVAEKERIDGAIVRSEIEAGGERVFDIFPDLREVEVCGFHEFRS